MASMRNIYDGLTVLMNYTEDDGDNVLTFKRERFWADGPTPSDLEGPDSGWIWNDIRNRWEY